MDEATCDESIVTLSTDELRVDVRAGRGARITSLVNRRDGREWLAQSRRAFAESSPVERAVFTETDHCGWDEMFPSVDPCRFPAPPFAGIEVPDHGELWTCAWESWGASATTLSQRARSDVFGYSFERTLHLDRSTMRCEYMVDVGDGPKALLWALHPQFSAQVGTRLVVPGARSSVLDTTVAASTREVDWPGDVVVERDVTPGANRMLYLHPGDEVDEAALIDRSGSYVSLRWDRSFARYLGVWADHARHAVGRVIAVEPTNGFFDDLARAYNNGTVTTFTPGEPVSWWVEVSVGKGHQWTSS